NQTFGITTGTLGCVKDGVVRSPTKVRMLMMSSLDNLAVDMARGEGETLESMADLMGVAPADKQQLFAALQSNFGSIFPNQDVTGEDVIASINQVLTEDAALSRYVII
ncbi:MAG: DUF3015 family protein, partial [Geminicoccaceae bacterium]